LRLELLKSFIAVADCGSYTRAAEVVNVSQPTLYQHVRQLEAQYGVKLVTQLGKRVVLTDSGRTFYEYARQVDGLTEDLRGALSAESGRLQGGLVLVAGTTIGDFVLPRICVRFQRLHPRVHINLWVQTPVDQIERSVREHEADLGFVGQPSSAPGMVTLPFMEDELVAVVPPDHELAHWDELRPTDIAPHPVVLPGAARFQALRSLINTWFEQDHIQPQCILEMNSIEGIKAAVREGGGVGLVSKVVAREDDRSLAVVPMHDAPRRAFYMLARTAGWQEGPSRVFRDYVLSGDWRAESK
jgi:DNA-binding transcriptional LysR family regulator